MAASPFFKVMPHDGSAFWHQEHIGFSLPSEATDAGSESGMSSWSAQHSSWGDDSVLSKCYDGRCREVQDKIELRDALTITELSSVLPGHVTNMMEDAHANFVLQVIFQTLPPDHVLCTTIMHELHSKAAEYAMHPYGCRVLCRMLEHGKKSPQMLALMDEMLSPGVGLIMSPFGSPVAEAILATDSMPHRFTIVNMLQSNISLAKDKYGCHVVERVLETQDAAASALTICLMQCPDLWTRSQYGRHVAKVLRDSGHRIPTRGGRRRHQK